MPKTQAVSLLLWTVACVVEVTTTARAVDLASFAVDGPAIVNGPQDIKPGKLIQSPQGKVIGTIKDVVAGPEQGDFRYALIATDAGTVAIPYWAISHLIRDGHIVIERGLLAHAPRATPDEIQDATRNGWKTRANDYWRGWR